MTGLRYFLLKVCTPRTNLFEVPTSNISTAGVAIMALGSLAANPDSGLKIIPCGMNYFHAHKFRSRAVIEFGPPIEVPKELVDLYKSGERRQATGQLLETVYQALVAVTVTSPDYDTLMVIALKVQSYTILTVSSSYKPLDDCTNLLTRSCHYQPLLSSTVGS